MPERVIMAVQYTPAAAPGVVRKAVGGFLRYVQYRDKHTDGERSEPERPSSVSGLLKYVAYRDRSVPRGLLFSADGPAGDGERRDLATFVGRALGATKPQLVTMADGTRRDRRRAVYRMVISPEHAEGLDLRDLTRAAMQQLASDSGQQLRWVAAEHRNTAHPHVHVVLAGFSEQDDGRLRGLVINRARLQRMKDALAADIARQRGVASERLAMPLAPVHRNPAVASERLPTRPAVTVPRRVTSRPGEPRLSAPVGRRRQHRAGYPVGLVSVLASLKRAAARYRAEAEREARGTEREGGWER